MLPKLDRLVDEIAALHSKLVLLMGRLGAVRPSCWASWPQAEPRR